MPNMGTSGLEISVPAKECDLFPAEGVKSAYTVYSAIDPREVGVLDGVGFNWSKYGILTSNNIMLSHFQCRKH